MKSEFSHILDTIPPSGIRKFFDLVIGAKDVISLGVGEPDFRTPWSIREDAIFSLEQGKTSYTSNSGLLECREAISKYLADRFDAHYDAKTEILLTFGVSEAVDIVLRSILNPGDEVIVPEPSYVCYTPLIQLTGAKAIPLNTTETGFIPDPNQIAHAITTKTKAIILCSPSNPTGRAIPKDTLIQIGKLAREHDFWIIADEVYAELTYDQPFQSVAALPNLKATTILLNGFSKAFAMTGWRLGAAIAPTELANQIAKLNTNDESCTTHFVQYGGVEGVRGDQSSIPKMLNTLKERRDIAVNMLNAMPGVSCHSPEAAFYLFPDVTEAMERKGIDDLAVFAEKALHATGVSFCTRRHFGRPQAGEKRNYVRFAFSGIDKQDIQEGMDLLGNWIAE